MNKPQHWAPPGRFENTPIVDANGVVHAWPAKYYKAAIPPENVTHMAWCGEIGSYISRSLGVNCLFCTALLR